MDFSASFSKGQTSNGERDVGLNDSEETITSLRRININTVSLRGKQMMLFSCLSSHDLLLAVKAKEAEAGVQQQQE